MSEPHTIPPHEPLSSENDPTGRWRIAELEADNERWKDWHSRFTDDYLELRLLRAEKAEAHAADCKRLVTACENDIDAERMKRREVEAELKSAKHLNAKWMDERTTALMDKEQAEALAQSRWDELQGARAALMQAEAEVAERDRMLRIAYGEASEYVGFMSPDEWFDFLRARAEEAKP